MGLVRELQPWSASLDSGINMYSSSPSLQCSSLANPRNSVPSESLGNPVLIKATLMCSPSIHLNSEFRHTKANSESSGFTSSFSVAVIRHQEESKVSNTSFGLVFQRFRAHNARLRQQGSILAGLDVETTSKKVGGDGERGRGRGEQWVG